MSLREYNGHDWLLSVEKIRLPLIYLAAAWEVGCLSRNEYLVLQ